MPQAQGQIFQPAVESYFNRAANGGLTCVYTGASNQTAHSTLLPLVDTLYAYPVPLDGGILDTIYCEVTTLAAGVARVGIFANKTDGSLYPGALVLDSGEFDVSSTGVKSTGSLAVAIPAGLYWFSFTCGTAAPTMRSLAAGSYNHILGLPSTMGATPHFSGQVARAYAALPTTFPASVALSTSGHPIVAVHYAS